MKWMKGYAAIMLLILAAYLYAEYKRPPRIDWTVTLYRYDKIPYGTYILHDRLTDLFDTPVEHPEGSVYERYNQRTDTGQAALFIARTFKTSSVDEAEMLRHLALGNTVFIATEQLSHSLSDTLHLQLYTTSIDQLTGDSITLSLEAPARRRPGGYPMPVNRVRGYFSTFDSARSTVLGRNSIGQANYIRMRIGKGKLFLHAAPVAFSNISLLAGDNRRYVSDAISFLPQKPQRLEWDDHFASGHSGAVTPLRVILTRPALRAAYFTALVAIILFILFRSKRRQRIIPVIEAPRNTTVDFVDTIAQLYLNRSNHRDIALKQINHFLEYVRTKYALPTRLLDAEFIRKLANRSGCDPEMTTALIGRIHQVRIQTSVTESALLALSRAIHEFKKTGI